MSTKVTKAFSNRYCQARLKAAEYNDQLLTRASAVNFLPGVTEDSLKKYELDLNRPPNVVVALMADAYNQPELRQWYCANECPLGKDLITESDSMPPERALIRLEKGISDICKAIEELATIMDDGIITDEEKEVLPDIKNRFIEARKRVDENIMAIERAIKHGSFDKY